MKRYNTATRRNFAQLNPRNRSPDSGSNQTADARKASSSNLRKLIQGPIRTLLIKGLAGTGKTTIALEILKTTGAGKGAFVSSRVPKGLLQAYIPEMEETLRNEEFLDIRLDDASSMLDLVIRLTESGKYRTIVFDSWDALAKELNKRERLRAEKMLMALAHNSQELFVFVSEEPGATTIDYLADGILELLTFEENDRTVRELVIHKMRGTKIPQRKYVFSLLEGRFTLFGTYVNPDYSKVRMIPASHDIESSYSFGNIALDRLFGGLSPGSTLTVEYNEDVPYSALGAIQYPLIANFLSLGRCSILLPLPGMSGDIISSILANAVKKSSVEDKLRILNVVGKGGRKTKGLSKKMTLQAVDQIVANEVAKLRSKSVDKSVLLVKSVSTLENLFASDLNSLLEVISQEIIALEHSRDAQLLFLPNDSPIRSRIISMSYSYAKLFVKDGTVMMYGIKPHTGVYALQHASNPILPSLTQLV